MSKSILTDPLSMQRANWSELPSSAGNSSRPDDKGALCTVASEQQPVGGESAGVTGFGQIAYEWLELKRTHVKYSTYAKYRYLLDGHIVPTLGSIPTVALEDAHLREMLDKKRGCANGKALSEKTLQDMLSVLRAVVVYAEEEGYIPRGKLKMRYLRSASQKGEKRITVMKSSEREAFEEYLSEHCGDPRRLGILLTLYTGLRIGELCALRWRDVDLENGILYVNHTLLRLKDYSECEGGTKTKLVMGTPKTHSSQREIPLVGFLREMLSETYRAGKAGADDYLLSGGSSPEEPRGYLYFYKKQLELCGLPSYTFHALRHTFATRCVDEGVDVKSLSEILGHSNVRVTLDVYVHPSLDTKRRQIELLVSARSRISQIDLI